MSCGQFRKDSFAIRRPSAREIPIRSIRQTTAESTAESARAFHHWLSHRPKIRDNAPPENSSWIFPKFRPRNNQDEQPSSAFGDPIQIVNWIATKNDQRIGCAVFKCFNVRKLAACSDRKQSHRVTNRAERGIDGVREQMNFNRLTLTGNNQALLPAAFKSFAHSVIHLASTSRTFMCKARRPNELSI